jgi:hypothetical protein
LGWINAVLEHIQRRGRKSLLSDLALIPNQNHKFISLSEKGIAHCQALSPLILDFMKSLGEDLRDVLVDPSITAVSELITDAWTSHGIATHINSSVKRLIAKHDRLNSDFRRVIDAIWPILEIVPGCIGYSRGFVEKQKSMFLFISILAQKPGQAVVRNEICEIAWKEAHEWCRKSAIRELSSCRTLDGLRCRTANPIEWLNQFYVFLQNEVNETSLDAAVIVPDQMGNFRRRTDLANDRIPAVFKDRTFQSLGLELRDKLIYPGITTARLRQTKTLQDVGVSVSTSTHRYCMELRSHAASNPSGQVLSEPPTQHPPS